MKQRKTNLSELPFALPKEGFVRLPQILAVIPISKSQFWLGEIILGMFDSFKAKAEINNLSKDI